MTPTPRIVVVDDKPIRAQILARLLKDMGYEVCGVVDSGEKALELVEHTNPDLVLMDIHLVGAIDAIEAATHIQTGWDVGVVYMFSSANDALWERSKRVEPVGYLMRPFGERELRYVIEMAHSITVGTRI